MCHEKISRGCHPSRESHSGQSCPTAPRTRKPSALLENADPGFNLLRTLKREVQANLPHLRLDHASYEAKGLPATWLLHPARAGVPRQRVLPGSSRVHFGCPDCIEQRALEKRKTRLADPDLDRHLALIAERFGEEYAQTYRLRCEGAKLKDIATGYGLSEQGVVFRLRRISVLLGQVGRERAERT